MRFEAYFFDLDDTLYPESAGVMTRINARIEEWMRRTVNLPEDEISELRERLWHQYGGTLPGLTVEYGSNFYQSMRFCHDVDVASLLRPNPALRDLLSRLRGRKYVFTSSYRVYAVQALCRLGVLDCFDGIIDGIDVFPNPKPMHHSFERAFAISGETDPSRCVFLDDTPRNIAGGHEFGFYTVQVGERPLSPVADAAIRRIEDLESQREFEFEAA